MYHYELTVNHWLLWAYALLFIHAYNNIVMLMDKVILWISKPVCMCVYILTLSKT